MNADRIRMEICGLRSSLKNMDLNQNDEHYIRDVLYNIELLTEA